MEKTKKLERTICLCSCFVCFILLISHTYNDIVITTRHGINFWDILLDGKILNFYKLNVTASGNEHYSVVQSCAYNILVYIVFAIWNLPLYLLERFAGMDVMNSVPCLVYSKLMVVTGAAVTALVLKKILKALDISEENHSLLLYIFFSSTLLVTVIFLVGQYDILSLPFILLGLLAYIKRRDKGFVLWFGISFCFKYFSAVIFLPLLLLRHKKVTVWIRNLVMLLVPVLITKLPFLLYGFLSGSAGSGGSAGERMAGNFIINMLTSSCVGSGVNLFILAYICLLVWCYLRHDEDSLSDCCGVWVCMVAYVLFFGLMNAYPYWSILLAPFVTLAIAMDPKHMYINLILETIGYAGLIGVNMLRYNWVYFGNTMKSMIWPHILQGTRFDAGYNGSLVNLIICRLYDQTQIHDIFNSFFLGAMIALAYTTYPRQNHAASLKAPDSKNCCDVLWVRFLINSGICLLPILAVFA